MASTSSSGSQTQALESAPDRPRRVLLSWSQIIGCLLLLAIPILSVLGVLGDRRNHSSARAGDLVLEADVPACARYGTTTRVTLKLSGFRPEFGDPRLEVVMDRTYLSRFSSLKASSPLGGVSTNDVTFLPVTSVGEGDSVVLELEITPEEYGWAKGRILVRRGLEPAVSVFIKTLILP
ncbi:MAG TPA: hypothetical protein PLN52_12050 [Opitutaceae bacterium]|nr:hypothetical protein [Opitutaceae bacterium]